MQNIPIEVLRTAVAIADLGTFTKAAERLGLSQPAVSSQLKKLKQLVGGDVFRKDIGGTSPTALGNTFLLLARKTLDTHDQILRLSTAKDVPERARIGFSPILGSQFMSAQKAPNCLRNVFIRTDRSGELAKAVLEGQLDAACCFSFGDIPAPLVEHVVAERKDQLVWVRSPEFVLSPGRPVPVVAWRGDDWMANAFGRAGIPFQIVFDGEDFESKRAAVVAGQGVSALPSTMILPSVIRAGEYYLPELPVISFVLLKRRDVASDLLSKLVEEVRQMFFPEIETVAPVQPERKRARSA